MDREIPLHSAKDILDSIAREISDSSKAYLLTIDDEPLVAMLGIKEYRALREYEKKTAISELKQLAARVRQKLQEAGLNAAQIEQVVAELSSAKGESSTSESIYDPGGVEAQDSS